jgi:exonuclease SbcD
MKIIHTSDWHLGQKFLSKDRIEEHQKALDWLIHTVKEQKADILLIAGDVFDITTPPNYARTMYYRFLHHMKSTNCKHIIITGGNHDSPAMLNAPKDLLSAFDIHLVGEATDNIMDEILPIHNDSGDLIAVVAAVPFLRDSNLRNAVAGQLAEERSEQIRLGIKRHFQEAAAACEPYTRQNVPIIAMGHLYATGALASDKQDNIYVGHIENIDAGEFPELFDYVALGHIHRQQAVGGINHIRYSGSLIPLSFSETSDTKGVYCITFDQRSLSNIAFLEAPVFRRLKTIRGRQEDLEKQIMAFATRHENELSPWLDILVEADNYIPLLDQQIREHYHQLPIEILKVRVNYPGTPNTLAEYQTRLPELNPQEVFLKLCETMNIVPEQQDALMNSFTELFEAYQQQETDL